MGTMRSALLYGPEDLRLVDEPIPEIGPDQILTKILACSICPTDVRKYRLGEKDHSIKKMPMNLGHEWVGEVVEVGKNLKGWKVGTRVVGGGFTGYSQYAVQPQGWWPLEALLPVPDHVRSEDASMVEPLADCIHSLRDQAQVRIGDTVVIQGGGPMALMHVIIAKAMGATIIVSEPDPVRREWALKLGADHVIDPNNEDFTQRVKDLTGGVGADAVIVSVGIPALVPQALTVIKQVGRIVLFGGVPVSSPPVPFDLNILHYGESMLVGCEGTGMGRNRDMSTYGLALKLIANGRVPIGQLITHRLSLEEANEGIRISGAREGLKVILFPWGVPEDPAKR